MPPTSSAALSDLGRALTLAGDYPGAERALRQAVAAAAGVHGSVPAPGGGHRTSGTPAPKPRDALLQYAALVGDREPVAAVATRIADLSLRIGEPLLAARWLDRAIDENGPSPALLARLADAAWKGGDISTGPRGDRRRTELSPDDPAAARPQTSRRRGSSASLTHNGRVLQRPVPGLPEPAPVKPRRASTLARPCRETPSSRAARAVRPSARASAALTNRSSNSRRAAASERVSTSATDRPTCDGRWPADTVPRGALLTISEASTFCSSRTLPGQS